jgi:hypothetical protein
MSMMRNFAVTVLTAVVLVPVSSYANDYYQTINILDCGLVQNRNSSYQYGQYAWLEYIVETQGILNLCGQWVVAVEANVAGVPSSGTSSGSRLLIASVRRAVPVPYYATWTTNGTHWATVSFWPGLLPAGKTSSRAAVVPPSTAGAGGFDCEKDPTREFSDTCARNSPLIVDMDRNGYHLTSVEDGVRFDLDADGTAEQVAWTAADADEAFLALDRNGNGRIDDGTELFGNQTPAYADRLEVTTPNGFEALRFTEGISYGPSRRDEVIDERDAVFSRLLLWRDLNHNGVSEPDELQPLAGSGLLAIETEYKTAGRRDRFDNLFRQRAKGLWQDGASFIYDVWLKTQ